MNLLMVSVSSLGSSGTIALDVQRQNLMWRSVWKDKTASMAAGIAETEEGTRVEVHPTKGTLSPPKASITSQQHHQLGTKAFSSFFRGTPKMQNINHACIIFLREIIISNHEHIFHFSIAGLIDDGRQWLQVHYFFLNYDTTTLSNDFSKLKIKIS